MRLPDGTRDPEVLYSPKANRTENKGKDTEGTANATNDAMIDEIIKRVVEKLNPQYACSVRNLVLKTIDVDSGANTTLIKDPSWFIQKKPRKQQIQLAGTNQLMSSEAEGHVRLEFTTNTGSTKHLNIYDALY